MESVAVTPSGHDATSTSGDADDALSDVLARLGERVAPIALARERTLPVTEVIGGLFSERGLVRGRTIVCRGVAESSMAALLVREAMIEGAWLAAVDVATFGADAAAELGIPLERVVRVDTATTQVAGSPEGRIAAWNDAVGAAVDGFDLVVTRVPPTLRTGRGGRTPAPVRKLVTRIQRRGAVVVVLGDPGALGGDVALTTTGAVWFGLGRGHGHLQRRRIDIEASGRRQPGVRTCSVEIAGSGGRVLLAAAPSAAPSTRLDAPGDPGSDPQAQVLAEMYAAGGGGSSASGVVGDDGGHDRLASA